MPLTVFAIVMLAALLHASWNAIVKSAPDKLLTTIMVTTAAAGMSAALIPFLAQPTQSSLPYAVASAFTQIIYFLLVARTYQVADMSQTYPLMRGTAPLLVAFVSVFQMDDALSPFAWIGVMAICLGIGIIALGNSLKDRKGIRLAFLNAVVIAGYVDRRTWSEKIGGSRGLHTVGLLTHGSATGILGNHGEESHVRSLCWPALAAWNCRRHGSDGLLWTCPVGDDGRADCGHRGAPRDVNPVCYLDRRFRAPGAHRTAARDFGLHHRGWGCHPASCLMFTDGIT